MEKNFPEAPFMFCGSFSGNGHATSAAKWLKRLEFELRHEAVRGVIPAKLFLNAIDMLLIDEAATWAETDWDASRLLAEATPTEHTVNLFRSIFQDKFPAATPSAPSVSLYVELSELKQGEDESVASYYKKIQSLMAKMGAKDRSMDGLGYILPQAESFILDVVMKAFIRGLHDDDLQRSAIQGLASTGRSLQGLYDLVEKADSTKKAMHRFNMEVQKAKEVELYRDLMRRNMPHNLLPTRLDTAIQAIPEAVIAPFTLKPLPIQSVTSVASALLVSPTLVQPDSSADCILPVSSVVLSVPPAALPAVHSVAPPVCPLPDLVSPVALPVRPASLTSPVSLMALPAPVSSQTPPVHSAVSPVLVLPAVIPSPSVVSPAPPIILVPLASTVCVSSAIWFLSMLKGMERKFRVLARIGGKTAKRESYVCYFVSPDVKLLGSTRSEIGPKHDPKRPGSNTKKKLVELELMGD